MKRLLTLPALVVWRTFFWTYERATWQYDLWVIVILAFIWGTPPGLLKDPMAAGPSSLMRLVDFIGQLLQNIR